MVFRFNRLTSEGDLHPVREAFTELATRYSERTRLPLELAHNCTVTERNLASIAEIVRWFLADPARSRVWRILSFQPEANTGRTIFSEHPVTPEDGLGKTLLREWAEISTEINSSAGTRLATMEPCLMIERRRGRYQPLVPNDKKTMRLLTDLLEARARSRP